MRKALFLERFAEVKAVSHFSDRTHTERQAVLGYVRGAYRERSAGLLQVSNSSREKLPESKDWSGSPKGGSTPKGVSYISYN
jgi:hypothetical protein